MFRCCALLSIVACLFLVVATGCDMGTKRISPPSMNAATVGKAAIAEFDTNGDGKISGDELKKCPSLVRLIRDLDPEGKEVTAEALQKMIEAWQESRIGRTECPVVVKHKGKPLADATVTLVPEKFLGANFQVASGKTRDDGKAMVTVPNVSPEGVPLGFYRVQITKEGESIPAKYNTETELGVGIDPGVNGIAGRFDLDY